ncbi:DUF4062 domain-containing protein [Lactococcus termiticola]|uniref:DUF4062 domain-containing protein n=1 Tax=Lactococcus termiticola TaxID=2169526 RepID=A0A2R5HDX2_9LACT|nr:DUF4062 domain-containing protein [Lactococcus termiticola]GBG96263.1 hypothetical protein NtB2_00374 [Lactococcus termiticola]
MAVPKVFISSTFYDLIHVRADLENFVKSLGYEPIMHERNGVAYTQDKSLEDSCYDEIANCDILICIIGNKFGTQSEDKGNYSITMNELKTAVNQKKKVYLFVQADVYTENKTYQLNKDTESFKTYYADDIKIHQFITDINNETNLPMESFKEVADIINALKNQFAGLFQRLIQQSATPTDSKTFEDFQALSNQMAILLRKMESQSDTVGKIIDGSTFYQLSTTVKLIEFLNIDPTLVGILLKDRSGIENFLGSYGYIKQEDPFDDILDEVTRYQLVSKDKVKTISISNELYDSEGKILKLPSSQILKKGIHYTEEEIPPRPLEINDDDLPF